MTRFLLAACAVAGAFFGALAVYLFLHAITIPAAEKRAGEDARNRLIAEQAAAAQREEIERKGDDAKLQRMSDYDLCVAYLGRVPSCDLLRLGMQPVSEE